MANEGSRDGAVFGRYGFQAPPIGGARKRSHTLGAVREASQSYVRIKQKKSMRHRPSGASSECRNGKGKH